MSICTRLFGISLPHILEPLGTPEKGHILLQQAGFRDISLKILPSGRYRSLSDDRFWLWKGGAFYPRGNPLSKLSEEQLDQLQVEYRAEIEKLATDKGVWEDTTTFFVRARKWVDAALALPKDLFPCPAVVPVSSFLIPYLLVQVYPY